MTSGLGMQRALHAENRNRVESTVRGFENLARLRVGDAARLWLEAGLDARPAMSFDPIYAMCRSNAGAALILLASPDHAERCLREAEEAWLRVIAGITTLAVPITGASSSFHFRLAATAPVALINARKDRYRRLAATALAITRFNHGLVDLDASPVIAAHAAELRSIVAEGFGPTSAEARLLDAEANDPTSAAELYLAKHTDLATRSQTFASALSEECGALESAVALTVLLSPSLLRTPVHPAITPNATC
ncbi:MAG: hypothetical protein ABWX70_05855 [Hyphomicrobium sp.]